MKNWDVSNISDLYEMLHYISEKYGDTCSKCKTTCCANQLLEIHPRELKELAKYLKMDAAKFRLTYTKTKDNYFKDMDVKTMSDRAKEIQKEPGRVLMFINSEDKINMGDYESKATYCPFYNKETHRCKVHQYRPGACRYYPFLRLDDETFEVRKFSECVITDKFIQRFTKFIEEIKDAKPLVDKIKKDVESKRYFNHYYLPWMPVLAYMGHEFSKMRTKEEMLTALKILRRMDAEKRYIEQKMEKERREKIGGKNASDKR